MFGHFLTNAEANTIRWEKSDNKDMIASEKQYMLDHPLCDPITLGELTTTHYNLNIITFRRLLRERFYEPAMMQQAICLLKSILDTPNPDILLREPIRQWVKKLHQIGAPSAFGIAMSGNLRSESDLFVLKTPRRVSMSLVHEAFVGLYGTNRLRNTIPNFSVVFGLFSCTPPYLTQKGTVEGWCLEGGEKTDYVLYENITPAITLKQALATLSYPEYLNLYFQTILAIRMAAAEVGFTHYDLHDSNLLVRQTPFSEFVIPYSTSRGIRYLRCNRVATIIDYGKAVINVRDKLYYELSASTYPATYPIADAYKLLLWSAYHASKVNQALFKDLQPLVEYFNDQESLRSIIDNQYESYFDALYKPEYLLDDYIDYIAELYPTIWSVEPILNLPILSCRDQDCQTLHEIVFELGMDTLVAPTNIFDFMELRMNLSLQEDTTDIRWLDANFQYMLVYNQTLNDIKEDIREIRGLGSLKGSPIQWDVRDRLAYYLDRFVDYQDRVQALLYLVRVYQPLEKERRIIITNFNANELKIWKSFIPLFQKLKAEYKTIANREEMTDARHLLANWDVVDRELNQKYTT